MYLPHFVGDPAKIGVNFGIDDGGLSHAGIYLGGIRYGALEESLTTDNYLIWTIESLLPEKICNWTEALPSPELEDRKWWERFDELRSFGENDYHDFCIDSNPFTDFYNTVLFRLAGEIFVFWRLRTDAGFWREFPSLLEMQNPGFWRFSTDISSFAYEIKEVKRLVTEKLVQLRSGEAPGPGPN